MAGGRWNRRKATVWASGQLRSAARAPSSRRSRPRRSTPRPCPQDACEDGACGVMVTMTDGTGQSEALTSAMRSLEAAFLIGIPGTTEFWLIRHADCYEAMTSHEDPPLSETGRDQARRLGERLNRAGYDAVYTSPLRRAQEAAAAITGGTAIDERVGEANNQLANGHIEFTEPPDRVVERMRASVDDAA